MALTTQTVNGTVYYPDSNPMVGATVTFTLSNPSVSVSDPGVLPPSFVTTTSGGVGTFTVDLWPNDLGATASSYLVEVTYTNTTTGQQKVDKIGRIQVPSTGGPFNMSTLLAATETFPAAVYLGIITEAQYTETIEAAASALDSADRAEAAVALAEDTLTSLRPVTPLTTIISDGTLTELTIAGRYVAQDQIFFYVGGVHQPARDEYYTVTPGASTTLVTFPAVPEGLEVYYRAMRQIAVPVADPTEIDFPDGSTATDLWQSYGNGTKDATYYATINDAVASDEDRLIVNGEYTTSTKLDAATGKIIDGRGKGQITRLATSAAPVQYAILPGDDQRYKDITVNMEPMPDFPNGSALLQFTGSLTDFVLDGVVADAGIIVDPVTGARNANNFLATYANDADIDGVTVNNSKFTNFFWGFQQSNSSTAVVRNFSITNSTFEEFGGVAILFNAPAEGALNENILVAFNNLGSNPSRQPFGGGAPGYPHRGSFAGHVEYSRLIGNHAYGYGGEFFRAEEAAFASVWLANTGKLNGKDGIEIIPNDAGGTMYTPKLFSMQSQIMVNAGLEAAPTCEWGIGLHVYTSVPGKEDVETLSESVLIGNIVAGWKYGYSLHQGTHRTIVSDCATVGNKDNTDSRIGHIADNVGVRTFDPSFIHKDILITDHDVAVEFARGGIMGPIHIRSEGETPDAPAITVTNGPGGVTGWTWETSRRTFEAGSTELELMPIGARIDGTLTISVARDGDGNFTQEVADITYDGTTLTYYRRTRHSVGSIILRNGTPCGIKNGNLAIAVFAGFSAANTRVQVKFDGLHNWE